MTGSTAAASGAVKSSSEVVEVDFSGLTKRATLSSEPEEGASEEDESEESTGTRSHL